MKKYIILPLFLLFSFSDIWACRCNIYPFTVEDFDKYNYIALVKVKTFEPFSTPTHSGHLHGFMIQTAKFTVEYLENYKGSMPKEFIMEAYNSSCDPGIRDGEEWIIFANSRNGYATVSACSHSQKYRNKKGEVEPFYSFSNIAFMRKEFKTVIAINEGLSQQFYPNKKAKSLETYKNGLLHGKRLFWYANGNMLGEETYKEGKRNGISKWWFEDGNEACEIKYKDGILVDTAWVWQKKQKIQTDTMKKEKYYLKVFTIYKDGKEFNKRGYFEDGTLDFEQLILGDGKVRMTNVWNENGHLDILMTEKWDENAKVFKEEYFMDYRTDVNLRRTYYYLDSKTSVIYRGKK
jgi:antitoxin component YwqK of YwqJK toxin-antitoxin module